jgi:hypothetical protein
LSDRNWEAGWMSNSRGQTRAQDLSIPNPRILAEIKNSVPEDRLILEHEKTKTPEVPKQTAKPCKIPPENDVQGLRQILEDNKDFFLSRKEKRVLVIIDEIQMIALQVSYQ